MIVIILFIVIAIFSRKNIHFCFVFKQYNFLNYIMLGAHVEDGAYDFFMILKLFIFDDYQKAEREDNFHTSTDPIQCRDRCEI